MPPSSPPVKTSAGQDELRHRTRGLGQRHRTVLLLVDGKRPLGDILAMAHQAGAQTSHFEELLHLGLIDMPSPAAIPEAAETAPGSLDVPKLTNVELDVHLDEPGPDSQPEPEPEPVAQAQAQAQAEAEAETEAGSEATAEAAVADHSPAPTPPLAPRPSEAPHSDRDPPVEPRPPPASDAPPAPASNPADTPAAPQRPPAMVLDRLLMREALHPMAHEVDSTPVAAVRLLHEVRGLLIHALGADASLFAPLVLNRVRAAQGTRELIDLVWEIERHRGHLRRARPQLLSLERARELLGMGNTQVPGDSQPGNDWPDTDPGR